jgi:hypothetical protein
VCFILLSRRLQAKLSRILYYREMMSGIDEFFVDTLNRAAKASRSTQEVRCAGDYMFSSTAFNFLQKNLAMEPPVYYVPSLYQQIEAFATVVKAWEPPVPPKPEPASLVGGKAPPPRAPPKGGIPLDVPSTSEGEPMKELPWVCDSSISSIVAGTLLP